MIMLVFLSIILVFLSLIMGVYSILKGPFLRFLDLFITPYVYLLRPIAILALGTSLLYNINLELYKLGFFYASLSLFWGNIGYLLTFPRLSKLKKNFNGIESSISHPKNGKIVWWTIVFSLVFLFLMFSIAGTDFLGSYRNASISALFPSLRYIYPFVQVGAALLALYGVLILTIKKEKSKGFLMIIISVILTAIIYQRGMTASAISSAIFLAVDNFRLKNTSKFSSLLKLLVLFIMLFLIVVFLRDIFNFVMSEFNVEQLFFSRFLAENTHNALFMLIAVRPDGDKVEIWSILMEYLKMRGPFLGKTFLTIPFTLTSSYFRLKSGLKTGLDILNEYYDYETYWYRKFGFNLGSSQELVLNFGFAGVFYSFIIGFLKGIVVRKFYYSITKGKNLLEQYLIFVGLSTFLSSFSGFHWMLFYLILATVLRIVSRFSLFKSSQGGNWI